MSAVDWHTQILSVVAHAKMKSYLKNVWNAIRGKKGVELTKGYRETLGIGSAFADWALNFLSQDGDLWQNQAVLRDRSRDLFKTDCYFQKYKEELEANVFGEGGIRLRMKVKEEADRVVYAPDEKAMIEAAMKKKERLHAFTTRQRAKQGLAALPESFFRVGFDRAKATVKAGNLDLYACRIIEERWREWQRKEFCTMNGRMTYNETRKVRLISAARDGDFFIRFIRGKGVNKFGFSLQFINSEWCDWNLNVADTRNYAPDSETPDDVLIARQRGTSIRMGIELDQWGKAVAYHFIRQTSNAWQWGMPGYTLAASAQGHVVISAKDVIHYVRNSDAEATRGAPWIASVMPKLRQLGKFEEAEVIAARVAACKMAFRKNTMMPEGGITNPTNPCDTPTAWEMSPGSIEGLAYGEEIVSWDPQHPNQNFDTFRRGMLRSSCAGMVGADYNVIANDLENINFSAGRLGRLDTNEMFKLLQRFDIETAERPIFEAWLDAALMSGAIPLPYEKFDKFNKPNFSGRRWAGVDVLKEINAAAIAIEKKMMSYSQWFEEQGQDLEEVWEDIAEEQMIAEELGIELPKPEGAMGAQSWEEEEEGEEKPKPKNGAKHNGRGVTLKV